MKQFKGVILDVDGTLVNSNDAHTHAWVEAMVEQGYEVEFEKVRRLIGMGGDKLLPKAIGVEKESPEGEKMSERRTEIFKERYLPKLQAFPQVRELLEHFKEGGMKLAVASSAKKDELDDLLKVAQATDLVETTTSSDDAEESKPDPDIIQVALHKLGLNASQVVMLGDTPYDIEAARKAGVATIALRCGGWPDPDLKDAIAIYDDPAQLLERVKRDE